MRASTGTQETATQRKSTKGCGGQPRRLSNGAHVSLCRRETVAVHVLAVGSAPSSHHGASHTIVLPRCNHARPGPTTHMTVRLMTSKTR